MNYDIARNLGMRLDQPMNLPPRLPPREDNMARCTRHPASSVVENQARSSRRSEDERKQYNENPILREEEREKKVTIRLVIPHKQPPRMKLLLGFGIKAVFDPKT